MARSAGCVTQTVVGLRYEQTEVEADAQQNIVDQFIWMSDNDFRGSSALI